MGITKELIEQVKLDLENWEAGYTPRPLARFHSAEYNAVQEAIEYNSGKNLSVDEIIKEAEDFLGEK